MKFSKGRGIQFPSPRSQSKSSHKSSLDVRNPRSGTKKKLHIDTKASINQYGLPCSQIKTSRKFYSPRKLFTLKVRPATQQTKRPLSLNHKNCQQPTQILDNILTYQQQPESDFQAWSARQQEVTAHYMRKYSRLSMQNISIQLQRKRYEQWGECGNKRVDGAA